MNEPPTKEDEKPGRWDLYIDLLLPAVTSLRQRLRIDEDLFRSHTFHTAPRDFVLWTALDEVAKTAMFLMKLDGHLGDDPSEGAPKDDWIERTSSSLILEEERLRSRRLCELLSQLVLFAQRDEEPYYRHFLLLEELSAAHWYNEDLQTFHGARSAWVQFGIDRTADEVTTVEATIDFAHAWYAAYRPPFNAAQWRNTLTSARNRIRTALLNMSDFERLSMGTTYDEAFGQPSAAIHYRAGRDTRSGRAGDADTVLAEASKLGMLGFCVIRRCFMLLGRPTPSPADQIARVLESNTEASRRFELLNERPNIVVGDFVVAHGYLGEVMEEVTSAFGYRSLRVELIAERPLPDLAGDWFRARDVVRVFSREALVAGIASTLGDANHGRAREANLRDGVLEAWNLGLREQIRSQMFPSRDDGAPEN
jgi:hypothetical protein